MQEIAGDTVSDLLQGASFRNLDPSHPQYGQVQGVEVARVETNSYAWRSGLRQGDIVLSINRSPIGTIEEFSDRLSRADGVLALHIQRGGGRLFLVVR